MNDEEDHSLPPELTELLGANPLPAPKNTDGLSFPFHINRGRHDTVGEEIFPSRHSVDTLINHDFGHSLSKHKEPEEVQGSADMALSIKCDDKVMTVAVEKDSLQVGVISYSQNWGDFFGQTILFAFDWKNKVLEPSPYNPPKQFGEGTVP